MNKTFVNANSGRYLKKTWKGHILKPES